MLQTLKCVVLTLAFTMAAAAALAQEPAAQPEPAPEQGPRTAEAGEFQPITPQDVARAKAELAAAVRQVDHWLYRSGRATSQGWKAYLGWNDLIDILNSNEPPPSEVVDRLQDRLTENHTGLERRQFLELRDALRRYADVAAAASNPKLQDEYDEHVNALLEHLEAYEKNPASGDDAVAVGRALGWLSTSRQATQLVNRVRSQYQHPNLYGYASQRLAATGINSYVDQVSAVEDNILGTSVFGTARLTGYTQLVLNHSPNYASMNILLRGQIGSNTTGYNGPATIHSTGATSVTAYKPMQMTAYGLVGLPATARAATRTNINDISAKHGIVEKIAWKRAGQQKSEAEAVASGKAAARVSSRMNAQSAPLIAEQNYNYYSRFRNPLVRRGAFPRDLRFSSRPDRVEVRMLHVLPDQLAAPAPPPGHQQYHDLALEAHESVVTNFGESMLGGIEMTDVRLEKLLRDELKAEVPEELRVTLPSGELDPDKEPWSITFSRHLPVRARFSGNGLWIAIRAEGFARGEGEEPGSYRPAIRELMEIGAEYRIEKTDVGATLRREGDVQVRFPNRERPEQILARDNVTVSFIRRKFRNLFKEEFVGDGIVFKGRWARAGRLHLSELRSDNAWLTLGWDMGRPSRPSAE